MLFSVIKDPSTSANDLNHDLGVINQWAHHWKMQFNTDPTKQATEILFSCKKRPVVHPPLIFNNSEVSRINDHSRCNGSSMHIGLFLCIHHTKGFQVWLTAGGKRKFKYGTAGSKSNVSYI